MNKVGIKTKNTNFPRRPDHLIFLVFLSYLLHFGACEQFRNISKKDIYPYGGYNHLGYVKMNRNPKVSRDKNWTSIIVNMCSSPKTTHTDSIYFIMYAQVHLYKKYVPDTYKDPINFNAIQLLS